MRHLSDVRQDSKLRWLLVGILATVLATFAARYRAGIGFDEVYDAAVQVPPLRPADSPRLSCSSSLELMETREAWYYVDGLEDAVSVFRPVLRITSSRWLVFTRLQARLEIADSITDRAAIAELQGVFRERTGLGLTVRERAGFEVR